MRSGATMAILALLMTGCATVRGSETEAAICDELRRALPSWSRADTQQSKEEGDRFLAVFEAVCGK